MSRLTMPPSMRTRADCRLCGSRELVRLFSLGDTPLANEFVPEAARGRAQDRFPLTVHLCRDCSHVQLRDIVDPERLFRNYVYVSSTSPVFVEHFRRYAEDVQALAGLAPGALVAEIGSNDGVLLRFFKEAGMRVLGVDPAQAIAAGATARGLETLPEFFDARLARRLVKERGPAALILANNVFAHADDLHGIAEGIAQWLAPQGLCVFEVSYLLDVVEKTLFDTIYHEHLSYHSVKPLVGFFKRHGLELVDALRVGSHGGSLRGMVARQGSRWTVRPGVAQLIAQEAHLGLHGPEAFRALFDTIQQRKQALSEVLASLKGQGKRLAGFGAPAKATTLMHHFGLGPETLDYMIDDSPWKQGLFTPGQHLPVVPSAWLYDPAHRPDAVLILAWNFAESIVAKHRAFADAGGRFIVPLPKVEIF